MFELAPFNRRMFPRIVLRDFFNDDFIGLSAIKADIYDDGESLVIEAELPGYTKDEIKVQVVENQLTISAARNQAADIKTENYFRRERSVNQVCRTFSIEDLDTDSIQAKFENGLLRLTLPKSEKLQSKTRDIEIN